MKKLQQLLNVELEDATIANQVFLCEEKTDPIMEATARILRFNYERAKNDPRPRVLVLGRWQHPNTGNKLVAGINLNYLTDEEAERLNEYLPQIYKPSSLKNRWWTGFALLPRIWMKAYRQYDQRYIHSVGSANIEPEPPDYSPPTEPGEIDELPPEAQKAIQKIREIEAQAEDEPPKEPSKKRTLGRLTKDTIKRIANFIKGKLSRNRKQQAAKQQKEIDADAAREKEEEAAREKQEDERREKEDEAAQRREEQEEKRQEAEDRAEEIKRLREIEDEYESRENFNRLIDPIIEASIEPKSLLWHSPANYKHWHDPIRFVEYQPHLRGRVLDYAQGTKFIAIYNIAEDRVVIDLADHPSEVLSMAGWDWDTTTQVVVDEDIRIGHGSSLAESMEGHLRQHASWQLIEAVYDALRQ